MAFMMAFRVMKQNNHDGERKVNRINYSWLIGNNRANDEFPATRSGNTVTPDRILKTKKSYILFVIAIPDGKMDRYLQLHLPVMPPEWVSGTSYLAGDVRSLDSKDREGQAFICHTSIALSNIRPDQDPEFWTLARPEDHPGGQHGSRVVRSDLPSRTRTSIIDNNYGTCNDTEFSDVLRHQRRDGTGENNETEIVVQGKGR